VPSQLPLEEQFNEIESDIQAFEKLFDSNTNLELREIFHILIIISKKIDMLYESITGSETFQEESLDRFYKISQNIDDIEEKINRITKQMKGDADSRKVSPFVTQIKKLLVKTNQKNEKIDRVLSNKKLIMDGIKHIKLDQEYIEVFQKVSLEELNKNKFDDKRLLSSKVFKKISEEERWDLLQYFLDRQQKNNNLDSETKLSSGELSDKTVSLYKFKSKFNKYWEEIQKDNQKQVADQQALLEFIKSNSKLVDELGLEGFNGDQKLNEKNPGFTQLQENISDLGQIVSSDEIFENFGILLGEDVAYPDNNDLKKDKEKKYKEKKDKEKKDKEKKKRKKSSLEKKLT